MVEVNVLTVRLKKGADVEKFKIYISSMGRYVAPLGYRKHLIHAREIDDIPEEFGRVVQ